MSNIVDYDELVDYYNNILRVIFNECDELEPSYWDDEHENMHYGEEYLNAYSYLQKAQWRLSDIVLLKDYYGNDDFNCFGLELLQEVCNRIKSYLQDTTVQHDDIVYEYDKYNSIVNDLFEDEYHNRDDYHDCFMHYHKLKYFVSNKEYILSELDFIKSNIKCIQYKLGEDNKDMGWCRDLIKSDLEELEVLADKLYNRVDDYEL